MAPASARPNGPGSNRASAATNCRCASPLAHPGPDALRELGQCTLDWVLTHFTTLPDQHIGLPATRAELEALLRRPAPDGPVDFAALLHEFGTTIAPRSFRTNHPRFLAFVPAAPSFVSVLGEFLCAATNFFAGVWLEAAGPSQVELVVLDWFKEWLGYPSSASGILTGGGSEANLTALVAARETLPPENWSKAILYLTDQRHWSVDRAAQIMGLRPEQVRPLPSDSGYRLKPAALLDAVRRDRAAGLWPWVVVANAGATNTGAVDPLEKLADICRDEGMWFHIDAAYGWTAVLTEEGKRVLQGIDRADSLTLDPHKWLAQTYDAGCVLVRESKALERGFSQRPDYMQDVLPADDEVNFCDRGLALTRRFRALKIWLSVQALGLGWYRALVEHCYRLTDLAQGLIEEAGFELLSPRQLSIVCFRYAPPGVSEEERDRLNLNMAEGLRETGRAFLSTTRLDGRVALRFCFVNWRTTTADVEEVVQTLVRLKAK